MSKNANSKNWSLPIRQDGKRYSAPSVSTPTNVHSTSVTTNSITMAWNASTAITGSIAGYNIFLNGAKWNSSLITGLSTTITGLASNAIYAIDVQAQDSLSNLSQRSTAVNVATSASLDSTPPVLVGFTLLALDPTHIQIIMNATDAGSGVATYLARYSANGSSGWVNGYSGSSATGTITVPSAGLWYVQFSATDAASPPNTSTYSSSKTVDTRIVPASYSTNFDLTQSPIVEDGGWIKGLVTGGLWNDVDTASGYAYGHRVMGAGSGANSRYADNIAIRSGTWGNDTEIITVVKKASGYNGGGGSHEAEHLHRFSITANNAHGYECLWGMDSTSLGYFSVVRWNGASGDYTSIYETNSGGAPLPMDGDEFKTKIVGTIISIYVNGALLHTVDVTSIGGTTWASGNPGIGFWPTSGSTPASYGWTSFSAGSVSNVAFLDTDFLLDQTPVSQSGRWRTGAEVGLDWLSPKTVSSRAVASALTTANNDCIALLQEIYTADHYVHGKVFRAGAYTPSGTHEIELLLRFSLAAHSATGYAVAWNYNGDLRISRWNGALGTPTALASKAGTLIGVPVQGDRVSASIYGNVINVYINYALQLTVDITAVGGTVYSTGAPGMGMRALTGATVGGLGWDRYICGPGAITDGEFGNKPFVPVPSLKSGPGFGNTYYVDAQGGSDSNNGTTTSTPFATLAKIQAVKAPGDLFYLRGTFSESTPIGIAGSAGTSTNWITYKNWPGYTPVLRNAGGVNAYQAICGANASYHRFEGLNGDGPNDPGWDAGKFVGLQGSNNVLFYKMQLNGAAIDVRNSTDVWLVENTAYGSFGDFVHNNGDFFYSSNSSHRFTMVRNHVDIRAGHGCTDIANPQAGSTICNDSYIFDNYFRNTASGGLFIVGDSRNAIVEWNILENMGIDQVSYFVGSYDGCQLTAPGTIFRYNISRFNWRHGMILDTVSQFGGQYSQNDHIHNNVFYGNGQLGNAIKPSNGGQGIYMQSGLAMDSKTYCFNNLLENNLCFGNGQYTNGGNGIPDYASGYYGGKYNHIWVDQYASAPGYESIPWDTGSINGCIWRYNMYGGALNDPRTATGFYLQVKQAQFGNNSQVDKAAFEAAHPECTQNIVHIDPLFVDPANGDFRIQSTSPARNSGYATAGLIYGDTAPARGVYQYRSID